MFVSPSNKHLQKALVRLNLCTERDFRRCRRRVRKLARGLPLFDFLWIDALRQLGALTPFQAKVLESGPPEKLCVGPCILLDRLGHGDHSETSLARTVGNAEKVVLKSLRPPIDSSDATLARLGRYIERVRGLKSPFVVAPHSVAQHEGAIILLSRYVAGAPCSDLLVRRGRFPSDVVAEIARQLAVGLADLESRNCLHGEIRLSNVRLTDAGEAVLVDAGVNPRLECGLLIRDHVPPDLYDGTAPELIGTGNLPTTASQMYAFGCLLWQLLAGRAPFPTGDPLEKLAAHRSRSVPDVRDLAPDVPTPLAEALLAFTQHEPGRRPGTFAEVSRRFGPNAKSGARRLSAFRRRFETAVPREATLAELGRPFPFTTVAAVLFVLSGAALTLFDAGAPAQVLRLRSGVTSLFARNAAAPAAKPRTASDGSALSSAADGLRPLPAPTTDGVILLDGGRYWAETVTCVGDLAIRGAGKTPAVIVVGEQPLKVACRKFTISGVAVQRAKQTVAVQREGQTTDPPDPAKAAPDQPLLLVRSQDLSVDKCLFEMQTETNRPASDSSSAAAADGTHDAPPAIVWTMAAARDPDAGHIRLNNTCFLHAGTGVVLASYPGRIEVDNCLKIGGALLELRDWPVARDVSLRIRRVTLRQAESLCRVHLSNAAGRNAQIRAEILDSVFDIAGAQSALILLKEGKLIPGTHAVVVISGGDSVIRPNVSIVAWRPRDATVNAPAMPHTAIVEGLTAGEFQFVGKAGSRPGTSVIDFRSLQIPRRSEDPPGIAADQLFAVAARGESEARVDSRHAASRR